MSSVRRFRVNVTAPSGAPLWFSGMTDRTWFPIATGGVMTTAQSVATLLAPEQRGGGIWNHTPANPGLAFPSGRATNWGAPSELFTGSTGACTENGTYFITSGGGHTAVNYYDNSVYALNLNDATPEWTRWVAPGYENKGPYNAGTAPPDSTTWSGHYGSESDLVVGQKCASPRNFHNWYSLAAMNGRVWIPAITGLQFQSAVPLLVDPLSPSVFSCAQGDFDPTRPQFGLWTYHGQPWSKITRPSTWAVGFEAHSTVYDTDANLLWISGSGAGVYTVLTVPPYTITTYPTLAGFGKNWNGLIPAQTPGGPRYVVTTEEPGGQMTQIYLRVRDLRNPSVTSARLSIVHDADVPADASTVWRGNGGWHAASNAFIYWNWKVLSIGPDVYALRPPADPMTGTWRLSRVPCATGTSGWYPFKTGESNPSGGSHAFGKAQLVKIGQQDHALVTCVANETAFINTNPGRSTVMAFKIPRGGV